MARRKKSSVNPLALLGVVAALGLAAGGYVMFRGKGADTFTGISKLDPSEYVSSAVSLRGNTYQLTAVVKKQLKFTEDGRLYAMAAKDEKGGQPIDLGVFFPSTLSRETIQTGQELTLKVEVEQNGVLRATELKRN